jgi:UDP-N-acetylmuramoyl-L-alanyl-D-glutamate--2,6-diaminopimelate ligase
MHHIKQLVPQSLKNLYHLAQAILANIYFGFPSRKIKVIGVTGTNGKTTTVQMITKVLEKKGKVGMASTINFKVGQQQWVNKTKFTTESSFALQKLIKRAVDEGCQYFVLETSSHALDQNRVWGIEYDSAVITNVTREHLDYHKTMENYRDAKGKLFKKTKKVSVVNLDMEKPEEFLNFEVDEKYGFTIKSHQEKAEIQIVKAVDIEMAADYSKFKIQNTKFFLNLPGDFNIENALAAICVGLSEKITLEKISKALEEIKGIPGRLEKVENNFNLDIFVDYAVTPDSLEKLYKMLSGIKRTNDSKIISVFGSCGERDKGKRPLMGNIVAYYADFVIVTNEDPYFEDPWQIITEVSEGVKNKNLGENFWKMLNRREAIDKALRIARPGDMVVVTGKGAEETMAIENERIPWNDKAVIKEELAKIYNS